MGRSRVDVSGYKIDLPDGYSLFRKGNSLTVNGSYVSLWTPRHSYRLITEFDVVEGKHHISAWSAAQGHILVQGDTLPEAFSALFATIKLLS